MSRRDFTLSKIGFCRSLPRRDDDNTAGPVSHGENAVGNVRRHTDINEMKETQFSEP